MMRLTQLGLAEVIAGLILLPKGSSLLMPSAAAKTQADAREKGEGQESTRDAPPHTTPYRRPALPEDYSPRGTRAIPLVPRIFMVDVVVNNTDPNLTNTDTFNDGETSITVNPANPNEIVVTAFSGSWGARAPLWHSADGGNKQFVLFAQKPYFPSRARREYKTGSWRISSKRQSRNRSCGIDKNREDNRAVEF